MLEFYQNGKRIEVSAIYNEGTVGQMVIFGQRVNWGVNPNPTKYPLSQYSCPSIFTIVEKVEGKEGYYILRDNNGSLIKLADGNYLYDAQEWMTWNDLREKEKLSSKQKQIEQLENHKKLLMDIMVNQGIRIVTEEQAKELGLN